MKNFLTESHKANRNKNSVIKKNKDLQWKLNTISLANNVLKDNKS